MASVPATIRPSTSACTRPVVSVFWITAIEPKHDTMWPTWRFSKNSSGSRTRCPNTLPSHWKLSRAPSVATHQPRTAPMPACSSTSRPKPSASTPSSSRSAASSAWSTTHCR